jgi:hypothetical protein
MRSPLMSKGCAVTIAKSAPADCVVSAALLW